MFRKRRQHRLLVLPDRCVCANRDAASVLLALQVTLDALVALCFLEKGSEGYRLTPTSATFLVFSAPTYLGIFAADILGDPILYDLYNNYRRVITEGYRRDPWEYRTGSNDKVVRNVRQLFTLGVVFSNC